MDATPLPAFLGLLAVVFLWLAVAILIGATMLIVLRRALGYRRPEDAVALGLLKERFARGEIDEARFERAKAIIER